MSNPIQETAFIQSEADAWFERNSDNLLIPVDSNHHVIRAINRLSLPENGEFADLGGGSGKVSARVLNMFPNWRGHVLEPSGKAVQQGQEAFPALRFYQGSITRPSDMPNSLFDLVIVCGVFTWVDRCLLSQAVANVDSLIKQGGYLVVSDFDPAYPRANPYHHRSGLFTYKQDYSLPFLALNTYSLVLRESLSLSEHTGCDPEDPYDTQWMTAVLRKDLQGRYFSKAKAGID